MPFVLLLILTLPNETIVENTFDLIELNHYYNDEGKRVFSQYMMCDWSNEKKTFVCQIWLMQGEDVSHELTLNGVELLLWDPKSKRRLHRIRAPAFTETWTQFDREVENRKILSPNERKGLVIPEIFNGKTQESSENN